MLCLNNCFKTICSRSYPIITTAYKHTESNTVVGERADEPKRESKRLADFRKKLRETTPIDDLGEQPQMHPAQKENPLPAWPNDTNPHTGEVGGPRGPEPTRYGDWERKGRMLGVSHHSDDVFLGQSRDLAITGREYLAIPQVLRSTDKRFISTYPKIVTLLDSCSNVIDDMNIMRIHGPTADEVTKDLNLTDKTCLITGANSGIGLEMTRCLTSRDCTVLMACRNTYAASVVGKNICGNNHLLRFYEINLASLGSVKKCSDDILKDEKKIDTVILNAGTFGLPWTLTEDMLETTFQVNYLSQYYLLMNLEKVLAPDARVVFVSSESHRNVNWDINDILMPSEEMVSLPKNQYTSIKAYNISKLCGILAMHNFGYRWINSGKAVFCAHPGSFVKTRLCRNWWPYEALYTAMKPFSKSIRQAASTPVYCATSPDLKGLSALYYKDCERRAESDLANDFQLSFRINDLTRDLISDRVSVSDDATRAPEPVQEPKDPIDETLVPSYSG